MDERDHKEPDAEPRQASTPPEDAASAPSDQGIDAAATVSTVDPPPPAPPAAPAASGASGGLALAYVIIAGVVIAIVAVTTSLIGWTITQLEVAEDAPIGVVWSPGLSIAGAVVIALGCLPMLFMARYPRLHRVGRAWLVAAALMAGAGLTRLVPITDGTLGLTVQAVSFLGLAAVLWLVMRGQPVIGPADRPQASGASWWALCAGGLVLLPWAWSGALGSVWETIAAAAAALGFGAVAAFVVGDRFWLPFATVSTARRVWGGGAAAGVALVMLASGLGSGGLQLPIMFIASALGFAIAALQRRSYHTGRIVTAAMVPAALGPLAFADSDEFFPLVFGPEFGIWHLLAVAIAVPVAWLTGLVFALSARKLVNTPAFAAGFVVIIVAAGSALNGVSNPGFHGEKLLIVMSGTAELSDIPGDREARLTQVHQELRAIAEYSQEPLRTELDDRGIEYRPFYLVNAIEVDDAPLRRQWLEARDDVEKVLLAPQNRPVPREEGPTTGRPFDLTDPQAGIEAVNAPAAWDEEADGSGITIGISDSGVDGAHPALAERYRGGDDSWADPVNGTTEPNDPNGHGTHALGLALGSNGIGVAPGADWMGCSNLPRNAGNPADYLACMEFMLAPYGIGEDPFDDGDPTRAAHVTTNSWGCPAIEGCDSDIFAPAMRAFETAGVFTVVAAGNAGPSCGSAATPPANYPAAFSVGAVNDTGALAMFSSRGPVTIDGETIAKPDVSAPGVNVLSAVPGGGYDRMTGTSMAAPHVAGAVAVLWSAVPELVGDIAATRQLLIDTAAPVTDSEGPELSACDGEPAGAGIIDVAAAVSTAKQAVQ